MAVNANQNNNPLVKKPGTASSGQFTNIGRYLQANKGVGENIAGKVTTGIESQADEAKTKVGGFQTQIGSQIESEEKRLARTGDIAATIKDAAAPVDVSAARKLITGESDIDNIKTQKANLSDSASKALTQAGSGLTQLGTESGRFNLLRQTLGGAGYSRGMQGLDNVLMSTEGANRIGATQQTLNPLLSQQTSALKTSTEDFGNRTSTLASDVANAQTAVRDATTTAQGALNTRLQEDYEAAQKAIAEQNRILELAISANKPESKATPGTISSGQMSQEEIDYYDYIGQIGGLDRNLFGTNLKDFVKSGPELKNKFDIATADQAQRFNLLNELLTGKATTEASGGKTAVDFANKLDLDLLKGVLTSQEAEANNRINTFSGQGFNNGVAVVGGREIKLSELMSNPNAYTEIPKSEIDALEREYARMLTSEYDNNNSVTGTNRPISAEQSALATKLQEARAYNKKLAESRGLVDNLKRDLQFGDTLRNRKG